MSDPYQGGSLSDMAPTGTSIPEDAGTQRTIPSVPNPAQSGPEQSGGADLAAAATNPGDIPRSTRDAGSSGEVVTAYGDSLPALVETKRLNVSAGDADNAKGHPRYEKHIRQKEPREDALAAEGPGVDPAPGEEQADQDVLRDQREHKET